MKVSEIMKMPIRIDESVTISDAAKKMSKENIGSLVVEDKDKVTGIITERDVLNRIVAVDKDPSTTLVKEIMSTNLITVSTTTSIEDANILMTKNRIRRLLIKDRDNIVGIITIRDISYAVNNLMKKLLMTESYQ